MKQKNKMLSTHGIKTLFETRLTQLTSLASESQDETAFKNKLNDYLLSGPIYNPAAARQIKRLIDNDGKTIYEASIKETEKGYEVAVDLPGFKKDEIQLELNDGYLTISAEKGLDKEEKDKKDKYIRRERYAGSMSRTFYVGESVTENDIHAKYENGILTLDVPKEEAKKVPEKRYISIEG